MSSQANTNQQTEPTMEEILASIRKIISEDQPAEGAKPAAARPAPAKAAPIVEAAPARAAPAPAAAADLDVLDLTDEIPDEEPPPVRAAPRVAPPPAPAPASAIEDDVIFQNIEPTAPRIKERTMDDDFISDSTRSAMGRAFQNLNGQAPPVTLKGGSIEAIFSEAVQQAFRPALKEWVDDHSNDIMDQLRPLIRAWMDEHLPPLIEARRRTGEGEGDQQAKQCEDRSVHGSGERATGIFAQSPVPQSPAQLEEEQHGDEQDSDVDLRGDCAHGGSSSPFADWRFPAPPLFWRESLA